MSDRFSAFVDPFRPEDGPFHSRGLWPFIVHQFRLLRGAVAVSLAFALISAALEVWLIGYAGRLVDTLAATSPADLWSAHGGELIAVAALVLVLRPLVRFVHEGLDDLVIRPKGETMVGWRAHRHVLGQSVGWFGNEPAGHVATQVRQAASAATGAVYAVVHTLSYVATYVAASLWLMASIDLRLVLPLLVWVALYLMLMAYIVPRYRRASERYQRAQAELTGMLVDSYANIDTIKLFSDAPEEDRESRGRFAAQLDAFLGVQRAEVTINTGMSVLASVLLVGLVGYAVLLWQSGAAPVGMVAVALALSFQITGMAEWLLDAVSGLFGNIGLLRESLRTVAQPLDIEDSPHARPLAISGGAIRLVDVSHHYGKGDGGLDRVSLSIAAGEKVALVGPSGAGKSTLVNLLLRFHELESGRIEIDGEDIRAVTQQSLRRSFAMVTQTAALLHRSVRDNIAYGRPDVSEAEIEAAAQKAAADAFIPMLQDQDGRRGYDAYVGERGVKLSGGQRQRIALARAILKDAPILILDEATSALDSEVEAAIQETLGTIMEGRTVIAIAHRLSTIARMDRIVVLDSGRIVEGGTHQQLLAVNGLYARLWNRQSGGYIGIDATS
jgi:ATP-binding cassette, subfamily B, multidrug efflux pump